MMASLRAQLARVRDAMFPRHMCAKKKRYQSEAYANRVRSYRQPREPVKLHVYLCPECGGYHLTRMEQPE